MFLELDESGKGEESIFRCANASAPLDRLLLLLMLLLLESDLALSRSRNLSSR